MKWAIKIRYLCYDNKWHNHTTKWYSNSGSAWEENDKFLAETKWLESSSRLCHKEQLK